MSVKIATLEYTVFPPPPLILTVKSHVSRDRGLESTIHAPLSWAYQCMKIISTYVRLCTLQYTVFAPSPSWTGRERYPAEIRRPG
jgi:hypothetical protein